MSKRMIVFWGLTAVLVLMVSACGLTGEQVDQGVQTVESMSPSQLAGLSATVEALPPGDVAAAATSAAAAGYITLSEAQVQSVYATVQSARATATAVGQSVAAGERVNATQVPDQSPRILYFFAQIPSQEQAAQGVRYYLNYTIENATQAEIYGNALSNPQEGSFPIYDNQESNDWVLWAANDVAWVEQFLQVRPDQDTGSVLQNVSVNSQNISLTFRDPQLVDGDIINVDVNGVRVIDGYWVNGRHRTFPITLQPGDNLITIHGRNPGATPPMVTEFIVSGVTSGPATQITRGLNRDETQSFTITVP